MHSSNDASSIAASANLDADPFYRGRQSNISGAGKFDAAVLVAQIKRDSVLALGAKSPRQV
jgi:hypothetical protein